MISSERYVPSAQPSYKVDKAKGGRTVPTVRVFNDDGEEVFSAGQLVPAGTYRLVDSTRMLVLEEPGYLPASFDGRRAEYCRVERPWVTKGIGR